MSAWSNIHNTNEQEPKHEHTRLRTINSSFKMEREKQNPVDCLLSTSGELLNK